MLADDAEDQLAPPDRGLQREGDDEGDVEQARDAGGGSA
jgi:hypothetical protein